MGYAIIFAGIAVGIAAIAAGMFYATNAQQEAIPDASVAQQSALEGTVLPSSSGLAPALNKEKWHEDPFADEAAEVRAKAGI